MTTKEEQERAKKAILDRHSDFINLLFPDPPQNFFRIIDNEIVECELLGDGSIQYEDPLVGFLELAAGHKQLDMNDIKFTFQYQTADGQIAQSRVTAHDLFTKSFATIVAAQKKLTK